MAAFFYFRIMETLQNVYNRYDYFLTGIGFTETFYEFQMEMLSIYPKSEIQAYGIEMDYFGKDYAGYLKSIFHKINKDFYNLIQHEAKLFPNAGFFYTKNIKKLNVIKSEFQQKFPHWTFIHDGIEDMLEDLEVVINSEKLLEISDETKIVHFNRNKKIKWLCKTNVLATLFYDMLNGQDKGPSLIDSAQEDLKNFLVNNFLDADGNELSVDTVNTYIRTDKPGKRAKIDDRIELGNVKPKHVQS
jgi:hypothetical protein